MLNIMLSWRYYALFMLYRLMTSASDIVLCWKYVVEDPNTRGLLNKCLYEESPSRGPTPYPFIYHFSRKRYSFRISSFDKWYPFHIPCLELCIPLSLL